MFGFFKKKENFPNIDWYCDDCGDYLNSQSGFHDGCGEWTCTLCGHITPINESEIIDDNDFGNDAEDDIPKQITVDCPICMAELTKWSDVDQAYCPTCDMWVEILD